MNSAERQTSLGNFWAGFFEPKAEEVVRGFWYPKSGPDEPGNGPQVLHLDMQRDVITPGDMA
jgi:hypothetical protein